jgi:putative lipoic acid-binding regulatory protein
MKKMVNINNLDNSVKKTQIDYPCEWSYRIIGSDEHLLREAAKSAVGNKKYTLSVSNRSSGGKYQSLNLELRVIDESERLRIFENLKNEAAINFVL